MDYRFNGLGSNPTRSPPSERYDIFEEAGMAFYDVARRVGIYLDKGQFSLADAELKFQKSQMRARLIVARKYRGLSHKDYVSAAKEFTQRMNALIQDVKEIKENHPLSPIPLEIIE